MDYFVSAPEAAPIPVVDDSEGASIPESPETPTVRANPVLAIAAAAVEAAVEAGAEEEENESTWAYATPVELSTTRRPLHPCGTPRG